MRRGIDNRVFGLVIVGGGPAGLAPLLAAHHGGTLDELLGEGVVIVERSERIGAGAIGTYAINSDSSGATFVDCLRSSTPTPLTALYDHPLARELAAAGDGAVTLAAAGRFLQLVGDTLAAMITARPGCAVLSGHEALSMARERGHWRVRLRGSDGALSTVKARHVVLATGAHQPALRLAGERVAGMDLRQGCAGRLLQSGDVLSNGGVAQVEERLAARTAQRRAPRVVVVGGSTSAAAVCHLLLHRLPHTRFAAGGVTLMHRRPLRIYYPDAASALAEGYAEFGPDDICPISGKVFRFAGFRLDSRELIMQARGIGGRPAEPRLVLHQLAAPTDPVAAELLAEADLVVAALGYRPHALAVLDESGLPVRLLAETGPQQPLVDGQCRILAADGTPLPGLFGLGLAAGFVPRGALGGEPSFRGQANGLWLWQKDVGGLIVDAIRAPRPAPFAWLAGRADALAVRGAAE